MAKWLTKSNYKNYLVHPAYLWLAKHTPERLPEIDERTQGIFDQGEEVDQIVRQQYPGGVQVGGDLFAGIDETTALMKKATAQGSGETPTLFQPAVLTECKLYARADIITRAGDAWDLNEVKSSTAVRPDHIADLAFQKVAFEEAGHRIGQTFVTHVNNQYVRHGEIEPDKLLATAEVTKQVEAILAKTRRNIAAALQVIALTECPDDNPALCTDKWAFGAWRDLYKSLHPELPDDSIYKLCRLSFMQVSELARRRVTHLSDIPDNFELGTQQKSQLRAIRAAEPLLQPAKIAAELRKLKFPLYFLDYETINTALPPWDGTRPYQQIPFQCSLHIMNAGGETEHREFLAEGRENPMPHLLASLRENIGAEGSVIVWNKVFEMGVNRRLGESYPEYTEWLRALNRRVYDLMEVFNKGLYSDARFLGSASIKKVLPVIVPGLNHGDLEISEGGTASLRWYRAMAGGGENEAAAKVYADLRAYCRVDTLAMVRIYEFLMKASQTAPGAQTSLV